MPESAHQAVFLSYASQDAAAARRICETLRAAGMEVWFDADGGLEHGDEWDAKIRRQIKECVLFLPLISANTQARHEGYFRIEWELAAERAMGFASGVPFILPIAIDATREPDALVPDRFRKVQWTRLQGGEMSPDVLARFMKLWSHRTGALKHGSEVARAFQPGGSGDTGWKARATAPVGRRVPAAAWIAVVGGLGAILSFIALRPTQHAGAGTRPPTSETSVTPAATPTVSENSISVLPFENRSTEPDSAYFADGIQEEVIAGLSLLSKLRVVGSRNSVEVFRASKKSLPQIARELGVAWVLRGNVTRAAGNVTVNVQLSRGDTDQIVWAKTFRSDANGAVALQAEILAGVITALKTTVSSEEKALLSRTPTSNAEAYDLYLRQRDIYTQKGWSSPSTRLERLKLLEKAVTLDPGFVKAWVELALLRRNSTSARPTPQALAASKAALETLERLAPQAPETAFARLNYLADTVEPSQALAMYENFARTGPPSVDVINRIGQLQQDLGRWTDAIGSMRRAIALDPVDPEARRNLIQVLIYCRRLREARTEQRGLVALLPDLRHEAFKLGRLAYDIDGSPREMEKFFAGIPRDEREKPEVVTLRTQWAQIRGAREEAVALARLPSISGSHVIVSGMAFAGSGDKEAARIGLATGIANRQRQGANRSEWTLSDLALMQAISGDSASAAASAAELERLLPDYLAIGQPIFRARLASIYAWAGDKDRALRELAGLLREPGPHLMRFDGGDDYRTRINVHELRTCLEFFPLQGDPRFEALLNAPKNNEPLF